MSSWKNYDPIISPHYEKKTLIIGIKQATSSISVPSRPADCRARYIQIPTKVVPPTEASLRKKANFQKWRIRGYHSIETKPHKKSKNEFSCVLYFTKSCIWPNRIQDKLWKCSKSSSCLHPKSLLYLNWMRGTPTFYSNEKLNYWKLEVSFATQSRKIKVKIVKWDQ